MGRWFEPILTAVRACTLQVAGLVARGNIQHVYGSCTPQVIAALRALALQGLTDPEYNVRKTANNIVSTLARQSHSLETWKDLFPALTALVQNPNEL